MYQVGKFTSDKRMLKVRWLFLLPHSSASHLFPRAICFFQIPVYLFKDIQCIHKTLHHMPIFFFFTNGSTGHTITHLLFSLKAVFWSTSILVDGEPAHSFLLTA